MTVYNGVLASLGNNFLAIHFNYLYFEQNWAKMTQEQLTCICADTAQHRAAGYLCPLYIAAGREEGSRVSQ